MTFLETWVSSPFFSLTLTGGYWCVGLWIQKKTGHLLCNPLLITVTLLIATLVILDIPYETYKNGTSIMAFFLTPVTTVLGLNIYRQRTVLKEYFLPVLVGCFMGCVTSLGLTILLGTLMNMDEVLQNSLLPKSVTTAIALGIAESRGGVVSLAAAGVMVAGLTGAMFSPIFAKIFKITDPVAEGLAIGTSSHALGTSRAMSIGKVQGAMSSIAICVSGIFTSFLMLCIP